MTVIVALLPYSVSLASHPDAWPYTHRGNGSDDSIDSLHTSNTGPEPQVYLPLAAGAQGLPFFSRVSCTISIPSSLSVSIRFNRAFSFIRLAWLTSIIPYSRSQPWKLCSLRSFSLCPPAAASVASLRFYIFFYVSLSESFLRGPD